MRQLSAIMFTDMVGFTALMQADEATARRSVERHRELVRESVASHRGELVQFYGDGTLSVFRSAVDAADCAVDVQSRAHAEPSLALRIGLHTGDVVRDEDAVFGDGVNVAARIQGLGVAGSVLLSAKLNDEIKNQPRFQARRIGAFQLRNLQEPMEVFALANQGLTVPSLGDLPRDAGGLEGSVAVLPFVNMSSDADNEFFADGVSEEVINVLTRIEGLKVTARTSSFAFKGQNRDVREIGRELGVATVLEGSVRRAGNRVRVTAQLVKTSDGYHLFSEVYDRSIEDIFATQDELAAAISGALRHHLGSEPRQQRRSGAETKRPEAHERFLRGLHHWNKYTPQGARAAISHFHAAAAADPSWAPPLYMEASAWAFLCSMGYETPRKVFPRAEAAARKAVELAPALGEAHMGVGLVEMFYHWDMEAAEASFDRALSLQPGSAAIHEVFSLLRIAQGRFDEAIALMDRGVELDPLSMVMRMGLARALFFAGRLKDAIEEADAILELEPGFRAARGGIGWAQLFLGDPAAAVEVFESLPEETGDPFNAAAPRGVAYALAGRTEDARRMLALLERRAEEEPDMQLQLDMAIVHVALGDTDIALDYLEDAIEARVGAVVLVPVYQNWDPVRDDPRFRSLMARAGLPSRVIP